MMHNVSTGEESSASTVSGFIGLNTLRRKSVLIYSDFESAAQLLRVLPSMNFSCSGTISRWTFVARRTVAHVQYPRFQLWRPNGPGRYERVYESSTDSSRFMAADNSGITIAEYVPPIPVPFEAGDVLGVYRPGNSGTNNRLSVIHARVPAGPFGRVNFIRVTETDVAAFGTEEFREVNDFPLVAVNTSKNQVFISGGYVLFAMKFLAIGSVIPMVYMPKLVVSLGLNLYFLASRGIQWVSCDSSLRHIPAGPFIMHFWFSL